MKLLKISAPVVQEVESFDCEYMVIFTMKPISNNSPGKNLLYFLIIH
jgi:hypothetical protein